MDLGQVTGQEKSQSLSSCKPAFSLRNSHPWGHLSQPSAVEQRARNASKAGFPEPVCWTSQSPSNRDGGLGPAEPTDIGSLLDGAKSRARDTDVTSRYCMQHQGCPSMVNAFLHKGEEMGRREAREKRNVVVSDSRQTGGTAPGVSLDRSIFHRQREGGSAGAELGRGGRRRDEGGTGWGGRHARPGV